MVDPRQLDTYTAADTIRALPAKLVTGYFWSGPKTSLLVAPQVSDSTHPIFASFAAQNHMFLGNFGAMGDARCLDTEAGMGGYPGLRCVKIYLLSYRCITNGYGCCTTLTESIVEGP